jgi:hypothetical protein
MKKIRSFTKDIPANGKATIVELTGKVKTPITLLKVGFYISAKGKIEGWADDTKVDEVRYESYNDANHLVEKDITIPAGSKYTFVGHDESGTTNKMAVYILYEQPLVAE